MAIENNPELEAKVNKVLADIATAGIVMEEDDKHYKTATQRRFYLASCRMITVTIGSFSIAPHWSNRSEERVALGLPYSAGKGRSRRWKLATFTVAKLVKVLDEVAEQEAYRKERDTREKATKFTNETTFAALAKEVGQTVKYSEFDLPYNSNVTVVRKGNNAVVTVKIPMNDLEPEVIEQVKTLLAMKTS